MKSLSIYLIVFFFFIISIFIQFNFLSIFTLVGTTANLMVVVICAVGLMTGEERGSILGGIMGLMIDILEGKALGVYILSYILLGYFTGRLGRDLSKDNRTTLVAMVGIGTVGFEIFVYLLGIFFFHMDFAPITFAIELGKETVYNMLLAIILFKILYNIGDLINRTKDNYYLL